MEMERDNDGSAGLVVTVRVRTRWLWVIYVVSPEPQAEGMLPTVDSECRARNGIRGQTTTSGGLMRAFRAVGAKRCLVRCALRGLHTRLPWAGVFSCAAEAGSRFAACRLGPYDSQPTGAPVDPASGCSPTTHAFARGTSWHAAESASRPI